MSDIRLTATERRVKERFVRIVETMMLDMDAGSVGRIADYVGEHGTDGDGGTLDDGAVVECLRVIVDSMSRR